MKVTSSPGHIVKVSETTPVELAVDELAVPVKIGSGALVTFTTEGVLAASQATPFKVLIVIRR